MFYFIYFFYHIFRWKTPEAESSWECGSRTVTTTYNEQVVKLLTHTLHERVHTYIIYEIVTKRYVLTIVTQHSSPHSRRVFHTRIAFIMVIFDLTVSDFCRELIFFRRLSRMSFRSRWTFAVTLFCDPMTISLDRHMRKCHLGHSVWFINKFYSIAQVDRSIVISSTINKCDDLFILYWSILIHFLGKLFQHTYVYWENSRLTPSHIPLLNNSHIFRIIMCMPRQKCVISRWHVKETMSHEFV